MTAAARHRERLLPGAPHPASAAWMFRDHSTMNLELGGKLAAPMVLGEGFRFPLIAVKPGAECSSFRQIPRQMLCGA